MLFKTLSDTFKIDNWVIYSDYKLIHVDKEMIKTML